MRASDQISSILLFILYINCFPTVIAQQPTNQPTSTTSSSKQAANGRARYKASSSHDDYDIISSSSSSNNRANGIETLASDLPAQKVVAAISTDDDGLGPHAAPIESSSTSAAAAAVASARLRRSKRSPASEQQQRKQPETRRPFVDCKRLFGLWEYLSDSYPALGDYLYSLALNQLEATANNQHKSSVSSELSQTMKLIGQLLSEAEQLAREKPIVQQLALQNKPTISSSSPLIANNDHVHLAAGAAGKAAVGGWLTKVVANPAYARIVQQYFLHHQHRPGSSAQRHRFSTSADRSSNENEEASYGRVAHFPHELDASRGLGSTRGTLDRLHILNSGNHPHGQQQQQQSDLRHTNEIGGRSSLESQTSSAGHATEVDSNLIPPIEPVNSADEDSANSRGKTISPSSAIVEVGGSSRPGKYVYGNVLLRPSQIKQASGASSADGDAQLLPIDKLRNYNRLHTHHHSIHQPASLQDRPSEANTYGRLVVAPTVSNSRAQQEADYTNREEQSQSSEHKSPTSADDELGQSTAGSLNKLRDQLKPSRFAAFGSGRYDQLQQQSEGDEITAQQQANSLASIVSQDGDGASGGGAANPQVEEEFEGSWHSGPLAHVEASRQVRRDSGSEQHSGGETVVLRLTTSSPGEVLVIN